MTFNRFCVYYYNLANQITKGKIGVIHFMLSTGNAAYFRICKVCSSKLIIIYIAGLSGIMYSIFSGQPMTFVGPTGLVCYFRS